MKRPSSGTVLGIKAKSFAKALGGFNELFPGTEDEAKVEVGFV